MPEETLTLSALCTTHPEAAFVLADLGLLEDKVYDGWSLRELCRMRGVDVETVLQALADADNSEAA